MFNDNKVIFDPVNQYKTNFKFLHEKNIDDHLEKIIKDSKIDVSKNVSLVKKINKLENKKQSVDKKLNRNKNIAFFINLLIFAMILCLFICAYFLYQIFTGQNNSTNTLQTVLTPIIFFGLLVALVVLMVFRFKKISAILKVGENKSNDLLQKINVLKTEALSLLEPLFSLMDWTDSVVITNKTMPILKLDKYFDKEKYGIFINKYKMEEESNNSSMLFVQSGSLVGNPLLIYRKLSVEIVDKKYTGSIVISYKTFYTDSNGKTQSRTVTQTLFASIKRPMPAYFEDQKLLYANEAVPNLNYSRKAGFVNRMSEKQISRHVKIEEKNLEKKANQAIKENKTFNLLGNTEFESLFNALDRNDEIEFRMLFTPLAQQQMVNLIKDNTVGYGDDFTLMKFKNLNFVHAENFKDFDFNVDPSMFISHNLEQVKFLFKEKNNLYFKHIYFALSPILATPLYQQHKPQEYIYPFKYKTNPSVLETESIANSYDQSIFQHEECTTRNILKPKVINETKNTSFVEVESHGYRGVKRTEFVPIRGGNGRFYSVPVHWTEYIPVLKKSDLYLKKVDELNSSSFQNEIKNNKSWKSFFESKKLIDNGIRYNKGCLLSFAAAEKFDLKEFDIFNKKIDV